MRRQRRAGRAPNSPRQRPWRAVERGVAPIAFASDDEIEAIHRASLRVLAETGLEVLSARARTLFAAAGAEVDAAAERVRLAPELVERTIRTAPETFTLHARNPARNVPIGGPAIAFCSAATPAFASDLDRGRRPGGVADFENAVRLCQSLDSMHFFYGYPVEPQDLPVETRHLDAYRSHIRLSDKVWRAYALSEDRVTDALEMARIARGVDRRTFAAEPSLLLNCNTNSPLKLDGPMADGLIRMAEAGQPVVVSAFTMAGAMAPATMAGALVEQNAECLAGMVLSQLAKPGAPVIYGSFTSNVDMRSGAVALGTPEFAKAAMVSGQLARRYRVPNKSSNVTSSNAVDAQAAYEAATALWGSALGGAHIVAHGVGWLEAGLTFSFEKAVVDAEMLQILAETLTPLDISDLDAAVDAIARVGPGGHFFADPHTLERYETAFYEPLLSDWRPYETWVEDGARTATERAHRIWTRLLAEYEEPALPPDRAEALDAYVADRKQAYADA